MSKREPANRDYLPFSEISQNLKWVCEALHSAYGFAVDANALIERNMTKDLDPEAYREWIRCYSLTIRIRSIADEAKGVFDATPPF